MNLLIAQEDTLTICTITIIVIVLHRLLYRINKCSFQERAVYGIQPSWLHTRQYFQESLKQKALIALFLIRNDYLVKKHEPRPKVLLAINTVKYTWDDLFCSSPLAVQIYHRGFCAWCFDMHASTISACSCRV